MKSIVFVLCSILIVFGSCSQDNSLPNHDLLIKYIGEDVYDMSVIIFCKTSIKDKIAITDTYGIEKEFYNDSSLHKKSYKTYVADIINQKKEIDIKNIDDLLVLNDTVMNFYNNNSFEDFLLTYTTKVDKKEYIVKTDISYNSQMSVIYCLYLNNYYTAFDCVGGVYFSEEIHSLIARLKSYQETEVIGVIK